MDYLPRTTPLCGELNTPCVQTVPSLDRAIKIDSHSIRRTFYDIKTAMDDSLCRVRGLTTTTTAITSDHICSRHSKRREIGEQ
jgi:hypothetical protein